MTTIYSWNVNGIRAVTRKGTLQSFIRAHQPDILCLQETKAERGQADIDLNGHGYHEVWNSASKKGYSGTAIFTKHEPLAVTNDFSSAIAAGKPLITDSGSPRLKIAVPE